MSDNQKNSLNSFFFPIAQAFLTSDNKHNTKINPVFPLPSQESPLARPSYPRNNRDLIVS